MASIGGGGNTSSQKRTNSNFGKYRKNYTNIMSNNIKMGTTAGASEVSNKSSGLSVAVDAAAAAAAAVTTSAVPTASIQFQQKTNAGTAIMTTTTTTTDVTSKPPQKITTNQSDSGLSSCGGSSCASSSSSSSSSCGSSSNSYQFNVTVNSTDSYLLSSPPPTSQLPPLAAHEAAAVESMSSVDSSTSSSSSFVAAAVAPNFVPLCKKTQSQSPIDSSISSPLHHQSQPFRLEYELDASYSCAVPPPQHINEGILLAQQHFHPDPNGTNEDFYRHGGSGGGVGSVTYYGGSQQHLWNGVTAAAGLAATSGMLSYATAAHGFYSTNCLTLDGTIAAAATTVVPTHSDRLGVPAGSSNTYGGQTKRRYEFRFKW